MGGFKEVYDWLYVFFGVSGKRKRFGNWKYLDVLIQNLLKYLSETLGDRFPSKMWDLVKHLQSAI